MTQRTIKPYMIGLAGGSASGKTSVCQILFDQVGESVGNECVMIALDSYYKPLSYWIYNKFYKEMKFVKIYQSTTLTIQTL